MKDAGILACIDADLKACTSEVMVSCDLKVSNALRLFCSQVAAHKGSLSLTQKVGNELSDAELAQLKRKSQERDRRIAADEDVSGGGMFLIRPEKARAARIRWPNASLT